MKQSLVIGFLYLISGSYCAKLPKDISKCNAGDLECLPKAITEVIQNNKNGRADLNLMSLDPLKVNEINIVQGDESPIAVTLNFRNLDVNGIANTVITKAVGFQKDPRGSKIEVEGFLPKITLIGDYKIQGKVLILPIQGNGKSNLTLDNVKLNFKFAPTVTSKNGKDYIQTDKFKFNFETTRLYLTFENLFNGDKALGENMNLFLNENWQDILKELKPGVTDAFAQIFSNIINGIFQKIAYSDIFLN